MCVCFRDVAVRESAVFERVGGLNFTDAEEQEEDVLICSSDGDGQMKESRRNRSPERSPSTPGAHRSRAVSMRTVQPNNVIITQLC